MKNVVAALFIISILSFPFSAFGEITLKLAHLNTQAPFEVVSAAMSAVFKSEVESKSDGQIKVDIYPDGVTGKEIETLIQVKSGRYNPLSLPQAPLLSSILLSMSLTSLLHFRVTMWLIMYMMDSLGKSLLLT